MGGAPHREARHRQHDQRRRRPARSGRNRAATRTPPARIGDHGAAGSSEARRGRPCESRSRAIARAAISSRRSPSVSSVGRARRSRAAAASRAAAGEQQQQQRRQRELGGEQAIANPLARAAADPRPTRSPPPAARSVDERITNASGPASAAPSNCSRSATGTMLVSSENSEPGSGVLPMRGSGASATIAPMCRAGSAGSTIGLDADQLQALAALREERATPGRTGDRRARPRIGRARPPAGWRRRRSVTATFGSRRAGRDLIEQLPRAPPHRPARRAAASRGRASRRAPPGRAAPVSAANSPSTSALSRARDAARSPPSCVRSITSAATAIAAAATRPPSAMRVAARVTKGGKVIRTVIVECELC